MGRRWVAAMVLVACGGRTPTPGPPAPPAPLPAPAPVADAEPSPPPAPGAAVVLRPQRARVDLVIDPSSAELRGSIEIDLELAAATRELPIVAATLDVTDAKVVAGGKVHAARPQAVLNGVTSLAVTHPVGPGAVTLALAFRGERPREQVARRVAALLPGAPRSFPFVDAPAAALPWQLTLHLPRNVTGFANAAVLSSVEEEDGKIVRFAETHAIREARVAFVAGAFELVPAGTAGRHATPLRFGVPRGRAAQARFAVELTPRALAGVADALDAPYAAGKLDVVVVPAGMGGAAPGLLALDEGRALFGAEEPIAERQRALGRELPRDLAATWSEALSALPPREAWLADGLPEWVGARVAAAIDPAWLVEPLAMPRGAALLSTLEGWAGKALTLEAVRATIAGQSFFAVLDADASTPVAEAAVALARRVGTPRIDARLMCPRGGRPEVEIVQRDTPPWPLPLCVAFGRGGSRRRACELVTAAQTTLRLDGPCPAWLVANAGGDGAWRVRHDAELLARAAAAGQALGRGERRALILDARALVAGGDLAIAEALALLPTVADLEDPEQIDTTLWLIDRVRPWKLAPLDRARFVRFTRELLGPRARALGWRPISDEPPGRALLRPRLLPAAAILGEDRDLVRLAEGLAELFFDDPRALHADIVPGVLRAAARGGSHPLFARLRDAIRDAPATPDRQRLLAAAGATPDLALANAALSLVGDLDLRDSLVTLEGLIAQPETRDLAWDFLRQQWTDLRARATPEQARALLGLAATACDPARRAAAAAFLEPRTGDVPGGRAALERAHAVADACIASERRDRPGVVRFLHTLR